MMRYFSILFAMSVGLVACGSDSSSSGTDDTIIGGNPVDDDGSCVVSDQVIDDDVTIPRDAVCTFTLSLIHISEPTRPY